MSISVLLLAAAIAAPLYARTVNYTPNEIVRIATKMRFTTVLVLPAEEKILDFIVGDRDWWVVEGVENYAFIKPSRAGISTNVTLITQSGGVYSFLCSDGNPPDLKVFIRASEAGILRNREDKPRFVPYKDAAQAWTEVHRLNRTHAEDMQQLRLTLPTRINDYKYDRNRKPFYVRSIVSDDKFTYIRTAAKELPALYEVLDGKPNLINFEVRDDQYIVPKVVREGYLALGKKKLSFRMR